MLYRKMSYVRAFVGPSCCSLQANSPTVALVAVPAAVVHHLSFVRTGSSRALNVAASVIPAMYLASGWPLHWI